MPDDSQEIQSLMTSVSKHVSEAANRVKDAKLQCWKVSWGVRIEPVQFFNSLQ